MHIYYDNNGTTRQCSASVEEQAKWLEQCGNASGVSKEAELSAKLISDFKSAVAKQIKSKEHEIIITSGASESNSSILEMCAMAYYHKVEEKPTIVTSKIEHSSILDKCAIMEKYGMANVVYIAPENGCISALSIERVLQDTPHVALVSIMGANNETGIINNLHDIGDICKEAEVPFHSDLVQCFGKERGYLPDAFSVSFHKFNGPLGLGLLGIHRDLIKEYDLCAMISGKQQDGLRGGTENIPAIAGGLIALTTCMKTRVKKNGVMRRIRNDIFRGLTDHFKIVFSGETLSIDPPPIKFKDTIIYVFAPGKGFRDKKYINEVLPNTLLISVVNKNMCNVKLREALGEMGITIGIGSTCNSHSKDRSHVIAEYGIDKYIAQGVVRISIGDYNTQKEVPKFIRGFISCIRNVIKHS